MNEIFPVVAGVIVALFWLRGCRGRLEQGRRLWSSRAWASVWRRPRRFHPQLTNLRTLLLLTFTETEL